jgi:hypothetical protein
MSLNIWDAFWGLETALCPCDIHFCEWLEEAGIKNKSIFHFGTGGHHILGTHNVDKKLNNAILGITASPSENDSYVKMVSENAALGWGYKVFFGDIYQLDERLLPQFDVVTLFHVGEFRTEKNDAYGALTDYEMIKMLARRTNKGGILAFYAGSDGYKKAQIEIDRLLLEGVMKIHSTYKTLPLFEVL